MNMYDAIGKDAKVLIVIDDKKAYYADGVMIEMTQEWGGPGFGPMTADRTHWELRIEGFDEIQEILAHDSDITSDEAIFDDESVYTFNVTLDPRRLLTHIAESEDEL